ncbi:MAG: GDSL-type esterase/lipase family protein [Prolixibacteraceae bacterium]
MQKIKFTFLVIVLFISGFTTKGQSEIWVGSWSCANYAAGTNNTPPSPYLANNTLRQIVRVSIGGDSLRVKFTNKTCSTPVTIKSVNIAVSKGGSSVNASTITPLQFNGNQTVTMNAYSDVTSDPVAFALTPSMRVAITIVYGQTASNADITSHVASRTDSYIKEGDHFTADDFGGSVITAHWFHINTIEVLAPDSAGSVAIIGNSITDGYGLSGGLQNRWTDIFSEQLLDDPRTEKIGVLNLGIGGTNVSGTNPTTGASRFNNDVLSQSGLRWIIIFYGTNDIAGGASASKITGTYKKMVDDAHALNIKVYGATITPFKGSGHYSEARDIVRNEVNEWIRTPDNFDACIDFDKAIRDPNDHSKLLAKYSNDWLHPNVDGYELLGKSVNLDLFTEIENTRTLYAGAGDDQTLIDIENTGSVAVKLNASNSVSFGDRIESYSWIENGVQIAEGETAIVNLTLGKHIITLAITDKDGQTDSDEIVINVIADTGVWIEAECGTVGSLWEVETDNNASNGKFVTVKSGNNSTASASPDSSGWLTYTFEIEKGGVYNLLARLICPGPNDDSFWMKIDKGSFSMWNGITSATWQWHQFSASYSLSVGTHTLTIAYREDGAKLDKLWITNQLADVQNAGGNAINCIASSNRVELNPFIKIYPNPVSDLLMVDHVDSPFELFIYNNVGEKLLHRNEKKPSASVDMSNYHSGIYLLRIKAGSKITLQKIIKI